MATQLVSISPSQFVDELLRPGLMTTAGPVALSRYVSTYRRSPLAAAVGQQLTGLINGRVGSPVGCEAAVANLRALQQLVMTGAGRVQETNWRHVFSGHGQPAHIQAVWNFILANRSLLVALPPLQAASDRGTRAAAPARAFSWSAWFASGNPLTAMVRDGVFGYDCLGLIGNYLVRVGLEPGFPSREVRGYTAMRRLDPITRLEDVRPLCLLVWPATEDSGQHIAIVDRVQGLSESRRGHPRLEVDIAQSSGTGPQVNRRVVIARAGEVSIHGSRGPMPGFRFAAQGSPATPVTANFGLMQPRDWLLTTA